MHDTGDTKVRGPVVGLIAVPADNERLSDGMFLPWWPVRPAWAPLLGCGFGKRSIVHCYHYLAGLFRGLLCGRGGQIPEADRYHHAGCGGEEGGSEPLDRRGWCRRFSEPQGRDDPGGESVGWSGDRHGGMEALFEGIDVLQCLAAVVTFREVVTDS